jgi:hypothetical protein
MEFTPVVTAKEKRRVAPSAIFLPYGLEGPHLAGQGNRPNARAAA